MRKLSGILEQDDIRSSEGNGDVGDKIVMDGREDLKGKLVVYICVCVYLYTFQKPSFTKMGIS